MVIGMNFLETMAEKDNADLDIDLGTLSLNLSASMHVPVKVIDIIKPSSLTHGYSSESDREKSIRQEFFNKYNKNKDVHFYMLNSGAIDIPTYGLAYKLVRKIDNYFNFSK